MILDGVLDIVGGVLGVKEAPSIRIKDLKCPRVCTSYITTGIISPRTLTRIS